MATKKNGGWGLFSTAMVGCFLVGFFVLGNIEFDNWFLKERLNAQFGASTTKQWRTQEEAVDLLETAYLLNAKSVRVGLNSHNEYEQSVKFAAYWKVKLETDEGKKALKLADDEVVDNFNKCFATARRLKAMMGD